MPRGDGTGYCSELCGTDDDCSSANMVEGLDLKCTDEVLLPRPDPANSGITQRCILQEVCLPCDDDGDCGGDFQCGNMGGLGVLASTHCGRPCETSDDCTDPDEFCTEDIGANGIPTGKTLCVNPTCPDQ